MSAGRRCSAGQPTKNIWPSLRACRPPTQNIWPSLRACRPPTQNISPSLRACRPADTKYFAVAQSLSASRHKIFRRRSELVGHRHKIFRRRSELVGQPTQNISPSLRACRPADIARHHNPLRDGLGISSQPARRAQFPGKSAHAAHRSEIAMQCKCTGPTQTSNFQSSQKPSRHGSNAKPRSGQKTRFGYNPPHDAREIAKNRLMRANGAGASVRQSHVHSHAELQSPS